MPRFSSSTATLREFKCSLTAELRRVRLHQPQSTLSSHSCKIEPKPHIFQLSLFVCVCVWVYTAPSNNLILWVPATARQISPTLSRLPASPSFYLAVNALITGRLRRIKLLFARNLPHKDVIDRWNLRAFPFFTCSRKAGGGK